MDQLLGALAGGQNAGTLQQFLQQYQQGQPHEGYSNQEVENHYQQVAANAPPAVYQQAAEQAFSRLSPQQRQKLLQEVQQRAQQHNVRFPDVSGAENNPGLFAQALTQLHQQQPGLVGQILSGIMGGSGGSGGSDPAKGLMAGIAAMVIKQLLGNL